VNFLGISGLFTDIFCRFQPQLVDKKSKCRGIVPLNVDNVVVISGCRVFFMNQQRAKEIKKTYCK